MEARTDTGSDAEQRDEALPPATGQGGGTRRDRSLASEASAHQEERLQREDHTRDQPAVKG